MNRTHAQQSSTRSYRLALLFSLVLLPGCEENRPASSAQVHNPAGADQQEIRQELVRGNFIEPFSLDPHYGGGMDANIIRDLNEGLVAEAPGGDIRPAVASHWEIPDSKTYVFHLRPNAQWSNGSPLTAHDFVYSWQRLVNPATASPHARYLADAKVLNAGKILSGELPVEQLGIQAMDDHTLRVSLESAVPYFLKTLVDSATFPIHRETVSNYGDQWTAVGKHVGNGAFRLSARHVNERIEIVRNPLYWDAAQVHLDKVTFLPIGSASAELQRYLAGEIDITASAPPPMLPALRQERPEELALHPTMETKILVLNSLKSPFNDVDTRRALALAIDRDVITEKVWQRGDIPAYSLVPPGEDDTAIFTPAWASWPQEQREAEARRLLERAGYSAKRPLKFTFSYMSSDNKKRMAIALAAMWEKVIGAEVELRDMDGKALYESIMNRDFTITEAGIRAQYNDPSSMLNPLLSGSAQAAPGFKNTDYDRTLEESLAIDDSSARLSHYASAEQILSEDMPIIPLFHKVEGILIKPHVAGYEPSAIYHTYSRDLWIEPKPGDDISARK